MNRKDIKPGDWLKITYSAMAGPAQGELRTGMGYVTLREGELYISAAWTNGTADTVRLNFYGDHVVFSQMEKEKLSRKRNHPDFNIVDWKKLPDRRQAYDKLDTSNWDTMVQYLFGGLKSGDIITNSDESEIIMLEDVKSGDIKGYLLKANGKWSTKKTLVFGLGIGYWKLVRDAQ